MTTKRPGLARARKAAGYTQEALAHAVGVGVGTVQRWEYGGFEPEPFRRAKLAALLKLTPKELETVLAAEPAGYVAASGSETQPTDLITAAELRQRTFQLEVDYDLAPSTNLLADATQHLARVTALRVRAASRRIRRELWSVEAEAATLTGQLIWDASQRHDHQAPRQYFVQAVHAAREVNDAPAEAYATLRMSYLALYGEKAPNAGLRAAAKAAAVARPASAALTGLALLHVAEANAMLGERRACEAALGEARDQLGCVNDADVAGDYLSSAEVERMAGSCYLFLGLAREAEAPLLQAGYALAAKTKSQAIALGNLALARLRQGEVDGAVMALHGAIDALQISRGGGGLNIAFAAAKELRPWQQRSAVQEADERLFALMAGT